MNDTSALTAQDVADILKISKNTVYELVKRNELNAYRIGKKLRFDINDVNQYKNNTKSIKEGSDYLELPKRQVTYWNHGQNQLFSDDEPISNGFIICGQDIILDILSRYLQLHPNGVPSLRSYMGSYKSLYELYNGNVQVATAHLWDGETGEYNIPFVKSMLPGVSAVIVHLACRMQGFYVAKGNPKNIKGWEDLKRKDISIINREKGSGTRVLLDAQLKKSGINPRNIKGYERESTSHLAIASTVARGGADIGIGNEKAGLQVKGIDFIPLQKERYEMVIRKDDINTFPFRAIMEIVNSEEFKMEIDGIGGYDLTETGNIIAET